MSERAKLTMQEAAKILDIAKNLHPESGFIIIKLDMEGERTGIGYRTNLVNKDEVSNVLQCCLFDINQPKN